MQNPLMRSSAAPRRRRLKLLVLRSTSRSPVVLAGQQVPSAVPQRRQRLARRFAEGLLVGLAEPAEVVEAPAQCHVGHADAGAGLQQVLEPPRVMRRLLRLNANSYYTMC